MTDARIGRTDNTVPRMFLGFSVLAALSAIGAIACDLGRRRAPFYVFKPLTTLLIAGAFLVRSQPLVAPPPIIAALVLAALLCSLAGDIALMFEGELAFTAGLAAFLTAHLMLIYALLVPLPALRWSLPALAGIAIAIAALALLWPRVGKLRAAVAVYVTVLTAMWLAAEARWTILRDSPSLLTLAGASLFMVSDGALACDRFVRRVRYAQALVLATYFPALWLITCSGAF